DAHVHRRGAVLRQAPVERLRDVDGDGVAGLDQWNARRKHLLHAVASRLTEVERLRGCTGMESSTRSQLAPRIRSATTSRAARGTKTMPSSRHSGPTSTVTDHGAGARTAITRATRPAETTGVIDRNCAPSPSQRTCSAAGAGRPTVGVSFSTNAPSSRAAFANDTRSVVACSNNSAPGRLSIALTSRSK